MAKKKLLQVGFKKVDKRTTRILVGHTRTGACTSKGKCYHGRAK